MSAKKIDARADTLMRAVQDSIVKLPDDAGTPVTLGDGEMVPFRAMRPLVEVIANLEARVEKLEKKKR